MAATDLRLMPTMDVGELITIVPDPEGARWPGETGEYVGRIEDVLEGGIVVSMPLNRRRPAPISLNSTLFAYINHQDSSWGFRAEVGAVTDSPSPILYLELLDRLMGPGETKASRAEQGPEAVLLSVSAGDGSSAAT
jgi:hypothetical protein